MGYLFNECELMTTFGVHARNGAHPVVIAHRGASHDEPENTLVAFIRAAEMGAHGVELDARLTSDGVVVVHHDPALADGRSIDVTLATDLPEHVPTLASVLESCVAHGLAVNVEIKVDEPEPQPGDWATLTVAVVEHLRSCPGDYLVTSFSEACVAGVRALAPETPTGQLGFALPDAATFVGLAAAEGHATVNPWDPMVDAALVGLAHEAGLAVHVWTVDEPGRMVELAALGVDGIITNRPDVLRAVLGERPG